MHRVIEFIKFEIWKIAKRAKKPALVLTSKITTRPFFKTLLLIIIFYLMEHFLARVKIIIGSRILEFYLKPFLISGLNKYTASFSPALTG